MTFLHPALLLGLGLVAVPVILHLLLRARPKRLVFPALRLLQQRRLQNVRRMRLRQLWLLLLRMALVAAIVLALARPALPPANYVPSFRESLVLAAVIALGLAAYFAVMIWWQQQRWPRHVLLTRRTMLRGGVGALTALVALLAFFWPYSRRVAAEITSPAPQAIDNLPVAAVLLCDTTPSMQYQFEGASRLDAARKIAAEQLGQFPAGSKATVLESTGDAPAVFTPDLTAVLNRLESLAVQSLAPALNDRLRAAIRFQEEDRRRTLAEQSSVAEDRRQDRFVREIYLLTDLAKSSWRDDAAQTLKDELAAVPWLGVYLVDVGIEHPVNSGVIDLKLSRPAAPAGGRVELTASLTSVGALRPEQTVELWIQGEDGQPTKRDQQSIVWPTTGQAEVQFTVDRLSGDYLQGEVRLVTSDPLSFDNTGHLTLRVLPPLEVLIAVEQQDHASYLLQALRALNDDGAGYRPKVVPTASLLETDLSKFDVICLINAAQPPRELWDRLGKFVQDGGGVAVFLGANSAFATAAGRRGIDPVAYKSQAAQAWLPAELKASLSFTPARQLDFRDSSHPLTQQLERLGLLAELGDVDFHRYWKVTPHDSALTLARWNDDEGQPALLVRDVGRGRVLLFASSIDSFAWNELPRRLPFLVMADQWLQMLSRLATTPHTLRVGDPVVLPLAGTPKSNDLLLRLPDFTQRRIDLPSGAREVALPSMTQPGHYQIVAAGATPHNYLAAFSANSVAGESDLRRLTESDLDGLLGAKRYSVARDLHQLNRSVNTGRLGQEVFGLIMAVLLLVFAWEQATATWFYQADEATPSASTSVA
jgi:hypothetical protein